MPEYRACQIGASPLKPTDGNPWGRSLSRRRPVTIHLVTDELQRLLDDALGNSPDAFNRLVDALRSASAHDPAVIVEFAHGAHEVQRRAAIHAAQGRREPIIRAVIAELVRAPIPSP